MASEKPNYQPEFASDLVFMKARVGKLGLYRIMYALDEAIQKLGWERAGDSAAGEQYAKAKEKGYRDDLRK